MQVYGKNIHNHSVVTLLVLFGKNREGTDIEKLSVKDTYVAMATYLIHFSSQGYLAGHKLLRQIVILSLKSQNGLSQVLVLSLVKQRGMKTDTVIIERSKHFEEASGIAGEKNGGNLSPSTSLKLTNLYSNQRVFL